MTFGGHIVFFGPDSKILARAQREHFTTRDKNKQYNPTKVMLLTLLIYKAK